MPMFERAHDLLMIGGVFIDVGGHFNVNVNITQDTRLAFARGYLPHRHSSTIRTADRDMMPALISDLNEKTSHLLFLSGPARSGKSTIVQELAEHLENAGQLAASFFFQKGTHRRNCDSRFLFPVIAYQLAMAIPEAKSAIHDALAKDQSTFEKSLCAQLQELIIEPCQSVTSSGGPMTIIIDGLDQCQGITVQAQILTLLGHAVNSATFPFRFLMTSRPQHDTEDVLDQLESRGVLTRYHLAAYPESPHTFPRNELFTRGISAGSSRLRRRLSRRPHKRKKTNRADLDVLDPCRDRKYRDRDRKLKREHMVKVPSMEVKKRYLACQSVQDRVSALCLDIWYLAMALYLQTTFLLLRWLGDGLLTTVVTMVLSGYSGEPPFYQAANGTLTVASQALSPNKTFYQP